MLTVMKGGVPEMLRVNPPRNGFDKIIRENGWSTDELARELGVARASINNWRSGRGRPTQERVIRALCGLTGHDYNWLFLDDFSEDQAVA